MPPGTPAASAISHRARNTPIDHPISLLQRRSLLHPHSHDNAYSADGHTFVFKTPAGIMAADLAAKTSTLVVPGARALQAARTTNDVYYLSNSAIMAAHLATHTARQIVAVPSNLQVTCANADGTLFAGIDPNAANPTGLAPRPPGQIPRRPGRPHAPGKKKTNSPATNAPAAKKVTDLDTTPHNHAAIISF